MRLFSKKRISEKVDDKLHRTQYGFRKEKSTNQAIHLVRRLIDLGERTRKTEDGEYVQLILLDWEKAFDKVKHDKLYEAMQRMGIDEKLISLTKQLYKKTMFRVEFEGQTSSWKTQETGIRQGCTLSPYLFLIVMTALFHDVHQDAELQKSLEENRPENHNFDEILYADDTVLSSTNARVIEKLLHRVEDIGEEYGLYLNKNKERIKFRSGTLVKNKSGREIPRMQIKLQIRHPPRISKTER